MADADDVARVISILTEIAGPDRTPEHADADTSVGEGGFWLDSADLLEVVLACEETFSLEIDSSTAFDDGAPTVAHLVRAIDAARQH
jgi:acyl carrier protein